MIFIEIITMLIHWKTICFSMFSLCILFVEKNKNYKNNLKQKDS